LDVIDSLHAALLVTSGDCGPGSEEPVGGLIPWPVERGVERVTAIGECHRLMERAVV